MKINKSQFKALIREVLDEIETIVYEMDPSFSPPSEKDEPKSGEDIPKDPNPDIMKHSREQEKKAQETAIVLKLKGLKPGKKYRKVMARMASDAAMADLEVIHAEIEKGGKTVDSMDITQLKQEMPPREPEKKQVGGRPEIPLQNLTPEERAEWMNPNTTKDRLKALHRLAQIVPGERAGEWEKATQKDVEDARERARVRASKLAAGTLETYTDPETKLTLPTDTSLWTDKEWDAYNTAQDIQRYPTGETPSGGSETEPKLKSAGKYKPRLSSKGGRKLGYRTSIGTLREKKL